MEYKKVFAFTTMIISTFHNHLIAGFSKECVVYGIDLSKRQECYILMTLT